MPVSSAVQRENFSPDFKILKQGASFGVNVNILRSGAEFECVEPVPLAAEMDTTQTPPRQRNPSAGINSPFSHVRLDAIHSQTSASMTVDVRPDPKT